jgi:hypothetical protein
MEQANNISQKHFIIYNNSRIWMYTILKSVGWSVLIAIISHINMYNCREEFFEHIPYEHYHKKHFIQNLHKWEKVLLDNKKVHAHINTMK